MTFAARPTRGHTHTRADLTGLGMTAEGYWPAQLDRERDAALDAAGMAVVGNSTNIHLRLGGRSTADADIEPAVPRNVGNRLLLQL